MACEDVEPEVNPGADADIVWSQARIRQLEGDLAFLDQRIKTLITQQSCERHPGVRNVWCPKCIEAERTAWLAALIQAQLAMRRLMATLEHLTRYGGQAHEEAGA